MKRSDFKQHRVKDLKQFIKKHKLAENYQNLSKDELVNIIIKSKKISESKKLETEVEESLKTRKRVKPKIIKKPLCDPITTALECAKKGGNIKDCIKLEDEKCKQKEGCKKLENGKWDCSDKKTLRNLSFTPDKKNVDLGHTIINVYVSGSDHPNFPIPQSVVRKALDANNNLSPEKRSEILKQIAPIALKTETVQGIPPHVIPEPVYHPSQGAEPIPSEQPKQDIIAGVNYKPVIKEKRKKIKVEKRGATLRDVVAEIQKGVTKYFDKYPCIPDEKTAESFTVERLGTVQRGQAELLNIPQRFDIEKSQLTERSQADEDFLLRKRIANKLIKEPMQEVRESSSVRNVPEELQKLFVDFSDDSNIPRPPTEPYPYSEDDSDDDESFDRLIQEQLKREDERMIPEKMMLNNTSQYIGIARQPIEQIKPQLEIDDMKKEKVKQTRTRNKKKEPKSNEVETEKFRSMIDSFNF